jgi:diaminopimelate decarboxylase
MAPISKHLLPANSSVDTDGALRIAGVRIDDLAAEYGTPLFVYDEDHIRSNCRALVA